MWPCPQQNLRVAWEVFLPGKTVVLPRILTISDSLVLWFTSGGPVYSEHKWADMSDVHVFSETMGYLAIF